MRLRKEYVWCLILCLFAAGIAGCKGKDGGGSNLAPIADAGSNQTVLKGDVVTLDGSGSTDANGDSLSYSWDVLTPGGGTTVLSGPSPTFTAGEAGLYEVSLTVNDGQAGSTADTAVLSANQVHVPDTGQTSGSGLAGEDYLFTANTPSYTVTGNGTVIDNITLLEWQKQDDGQTRHWDAASSYCAGLYLAGGGWRLPTPFELVTIADYGRSDPAIDNTVFTDAKSLPFYWTSVSGRSSTDVWIWDSYEGGVLTAPKSTTPDGGYARCVRGVNLASVFSDNSDGTVTDKATNLMWQKEDNGEPVNWEAALAYCETLVLPSGGFDDWRLPNVKELASLEDFSRYPVNNDAFFPNAKESVYWSSTSVEGSGGSAWHISFLGGNILSIEQGKTDFSYVRCVRGQ